MAKPFIEKLAVIGVGLIGGSFAAALKDAGAVGSVVGVGRSRANLDRALALGLIDSATDDYGSALRDASLVMLAMPVGQTEAVLARIAPHLGAETIITDAGSTKSDVVAAARRVLGPRVPQFVPGHPIAGAEKSGADAARVDLFRGKKTIVTALPENAAADVERVRACWRACGAEIRDMNPEEHDAVFGAVSHLPHLLAYALVYEMAQHADAKRLFDYAGSGFRDFTRIASSDPVMWRDICVANRERVGEELARYQARLDEMKRLLAAGDSAGLERVFSEARAARDAWIARNSGSSGNGGGE